MRSKEDAHDYRYFPEPDLQRSKFPPNLSNKLSGNAELPDAMRDRL
jgi:Asp-tRNA(Asn)/Glu-tRNA(Gln) amidotransferase B subunit